MLLNIKVNGLFLRIWSWESKCRGVIILINDFEVDFVIKKERKLLMINLLEKNLLMLFLIKDFRLENFKIKEIKTKDFVNYFA